MVFSSSLCLHPPWPIAGGVASSTAAGEGVRRGVSRQEGKALPRTGLHTETQRLFRILACFPLLVRLCHGFFPGFFHLLGFCRFLRLQGLPLGLETPKSE